MMRPFQRWVLSNGLIVLYRQSPGVPLAAGTMLFRTGSREELPAQAGLANITYELMLQGTHRRNARKIADEIESIGASLGVQTYEDYTDIGFMSPVSHLDHVLDVLADVVQNPLFPDTEVKKERESILASLKSRQDSLFTVAYDAFNAQLFGSHPYGRPIEGASETIRRFTRNDFKAWHQSHIHPDRAILSLVSSAPVPDVRRVLEKYFGRWKPHAEFSSSQPELPTVSKAQRTALKARFEQAYLMTGVRAPAVSEPDYVPLKVLNTILGGGMSSRLFLRLREELSLAYEVASFYPTHGLASQWVIYLGLPPKRLAFAKHELERLLSRFQRQGPTNPEVRQAVAMMKGSYVMEHQTRRRQAWYAAWWEFLGKSQAGDKLFLKALDRVTPAQLRSLARRLLSQPRVTVEVTPRGRK